MVIRKYYGTPVSEARRLYFETSGLPFEQQLDQLFPEKPVNAYVASQFEDWKDTYLQDVSLPSETKKLLHNWQDCGFNTAISSNNLDSYVKRLATNWPVDAALGYQSGEDFHKGEPHFKKLENDLDCTREQMLFIGDSPNDARIAHQCNVSFVALLSEEFILDDFTKHYPGVKSIKQLNDINEQKLL